MACAEVVAAVGTGAAAGSIGADHNIIRAGDLGVTRRPAIATNGRALQ